MGKALPIDPSVFEGINEEVQKAYDLPQNGSSDWPDPEAIELPLPSVESITKEMLPEPFQEWLVDISERLQVPLEFVAAPAILMISSIIGSRCTIRPKRNDDWVVVPNLWGGVVGSPSVLKTPSLAEATRYLKKLEAQSVTNFEIEKLEYTVEKEAISVEVEATKQRLKKAFKDGDDTEILKAKLKELKESEPEEPFLKRYRTNDVTMEKLADLLMQNPDGIMVFRDELMGLLASFEKDGHEGARTFYLEGWTGNGSYNLDRIQRGTQFIKKICISVIGGIQPQKLESYLRKIISGENDGLLQRFQLLVYPDEPKTAKYVDRQPNYQERERAEWIMKKIAEADFLQDYGALSNKYGGDNHYLQFSEEAQELFIPWYTALNERLLNDEELLPIMKEHLGKYRSLMPSLALIFHCINIADGEEVQGGISVHATNQAIQWCKVLETHANRIYNGLGNAAHSATIALSKKILTKKLTGEFSAREVAQKGWSGLDRTAIVEKAIGDLMEADW